MSSVTDLEPAKPAKKALSRRRHRGAKPPKLTPDQRTRVARHARELERHYRSLIEAQGREVDLHSDFLIGQLATAMVHVRVARAALSRGALPDDEQLQRWMGLALRLGKQLRLKPGAIEPPAKPKARRSLAATLSNGVTP
jgi:hypothetical protein